MDEINTVKENIVHWLEKEECAFGGLDDLWRDKVNTTGAKTVRELFERYETERGPLSTDELKDLLRDLAYVHITCRAFSQTHTTSSSTDLPFGNNVTSALEGSSSNAAAAAGFQLSPSWTMVTGRHQLRVKLPSKPSSHDWCPMTSGAKEELEQNMREEIERLNLKVRQLEQELEREKANNIRCQRQVSHLQQEVVAKDVELRNQHGVMGVIRDQLRESRRTAAEEQLSRELLEAELQRRAGEFQQQLQQHREEFQRQLQQQNANLQHIERVAEERCALHQQPERRTWIIQRNEVVLSDKVLGEGSWAVVREGTFRGSPVAVKELHNAILSPHNRRLFEREMEISSRCRHFNTVQLMGATLADQSPLLVTERLDCNMRQLLARRELNRGEIVSLAVDVARGLNCMHRNQHPIVHRDVKLDNILVKRWGESLIAKVSDFGSANFVRRVMTPNQGTPLYSAPESSTEQYSQPVDVYSFGLLLLEMCIREYAVPDQLSDQIRHVPCPRLQELIARCVHRVPERRPSMDEVIQMLTQLRE